MAVNTQPKLSKQDLVSILHHLASDHLPDLQYKVYVVQNQVQIKVFLNAIRRRINFLPKEISFLKLVMKFDSMPDAELEKIQRRLSALKKKTPHQKNQLLAIYNVRKLTPITLRQNPPVPKTKAKSSPKP